MTAGRQEERTVLRDRRYGVDKLEWGRVIRLDTMASIIAAEPEINPAVPR